MGIFSLIEVPIRMHRHMFSFLPDTFVETRIRRYATIIERSMYHKDQGLEHKAEEAERRGSIHGVINAEKKILSNVLKVKEKIEMEKIMPKEDTVVEDVIKKLTKCVETITRVKDKSKPIQDTMALLKRAGQDIENLTKMELGKIQRIKDGSVVYTSLAQFDEGSVAAIVGGEAVKERREIRRINSNISRLLSDMQDLASAKISGRIDEVKMRKAENMVFEDAKNLEKDIAEFSASAAIMVLRTIDLVLFLEHLIQNKEKKIEKYKNEGFPKDKAEYLLKQYQKILDLLHSDEGQELLRQRILLSEEVREEAEAA